MRTAFFIDGYNLFYGLLANTPYKYRSKTEHSQDTRFGTVIDVGTI